MTACVHGDVCREYLRQNRGIICQTCPTGCRFYEPKRETAQLEAKLDRVGRLVDVFKTEARTMATMRRYEPSKGMVEGMRGALLLAANEIEDALR